MPRSCLVLFLLLALTGCGPGWQRTEPTPGTEPPPRDQFLVHHGGRVDRWHALRVTADSVSGIPWLSAVECDSCRVALPRTAVDSLREGDPTAGFGRGVGLAFGAMLFFCALACPRGD